MVRHDEKKNSPNHPNIIAGGDNKQAVHHVCREREMKRVEKAG